VFPVVTEVVDVGERLEWADGFGQRDAITVLDIPVVTEVRLGCAVPARVKTVVA
jgi:hypothetical protein